MSDQAVHHSMRWAISINLDIGDAGMDGYEVARRIRQLPGLANVVPAALSGWRQQEDRRRTAEAGFESMSALSGPPQLTQAAVDAVKQWRYKPTMLNGAAIAIITNVTVMF